jgi:hypothetical protein
MDSIDTSISQAGRPEGDTSTAPPSAYPSPPLPPVNGSTRSAEEPTTQVTAPMASVPPAATAAHSSLVPTTGEQCPACGALMAADQRYCLECGQRRGEPRLPFMDAVVLMDTVVKGPRQTPPPPPRKRRPRLSANATLIAGIGTLLLALGVGVLIGRSGEHTNAASSTPVVVKVPGSGETTGTTATKTGAGSGAKTGSKATVSKAKASSATGSSGQSKAAESVLHPANGVKLAPPTTKVGEKCSKGTAGCSKGGKFTGEFFGE